MKSSKTPAKMATSAMPMSKSMSKTHMPMSQGKMKTSHGVVPEGKTKGMLNASGRIGADCKGFSGASYSEAPGNIGKGKRI